MFAFISSRSGSQSAMLLRWALQGHHGPLVVNSYVVFHILMIFVYVSWLYIQLTLDNRVPTFLEKSCQLLAICSFCGCFIVFVNFSPWCCWAWCWSNCISSWALLFTIGIKQGFSCINTFARSRGRCWKPRPEAAVFNTSRGTWRILIKLNNHVRSLLLHKNWK